MQQPVETMIKTYVGSKAFQKEAEHLSKQGWTVASTVEHKRRSGCMRGCLLGLFSLVWPPKPEIVVTYQRQRVQRQQPPQQPYPPRTYPQQPPYPPQQPPRQ